MFNLPVHDSKAELGERGVRLVQEAVEGDLGWIFRAKRKADLGVDGEIEIVHNDRRATNRLLSVQIKCGHSFLSEKTDVGYIFRGKLEHLRYWLDHSLPVLLVLCNPDTSVCHWVEVTPGSATILKAGWKIVVPYTNLLNAEARWSIERIAKRSHFEDAIELAIYRWLHEKYFRRIEIAPTLDLPRDYQWYTYLARIDGEVVMVHHIYDRYGRFDDEELAKALQYKSSNEQQCGATKLIICLISQNRSAFQYNKSFQKLLEQDPNVTFVRFLHDVDTMFLNEIDDDDNIIEDYSQGTPIIFGHTLFES